ncbi:hypothetical protein RugamoR1_12150 [Rugamonas sp. R1(2021)]
MLGQVNIGIKECDKADIFYQSEVVVGEAVNQAKRQGRRHNHVQRGRETLQTTEIKIFQCESALILRILDGAANDVSRDDEKDVYANKSPRENVESGVAEHHQ